MNNLTNNKIIFSIDESLFPEKYYLVSAYILVSIDNKIVLHCKFITPITLDYHHSYTAELCSTLGIWIILDEYSPKENISKIKVGISTDC